MKIIALLMTSLLLSACAFDVNLENRVACTVAGDQLLYISKYGPLGVASQVDAKDQAVVCKK